MKENLPQKVELQEVVLRDGIQNEKLIVPTIEKVNLINSLTACGLKRIEVSSFVNPRLVPQMADAEELWESIERKEGVLYSALIFSENGLDQAIHCDVPHVGIFVSASETHSMKNSNKSIAEATKDVLKLLKKGRSAGMEVRAGVMNAFGCAYEGEVPAERVTGLVGDLMAEGPDEICLADTSGMANPWQMKEVLSLVKELTGDKTISLHLHNTRGMGLANVWAALQEGITAFDTSLGGLGGCPFIPGAKGNIATEDTVYMLEDMGIKTGVDLDQLIEVSLSFEKFFGKEFPAVISRLEGKR